MAPRVGVSVSFLGAEGCTGVCALAGTAHCEGPAVDLQLSCESTASPRLRWVLYSVRGLFVAASLQWWWLRWHLACIRTVCLLSDLQLFCAAFKAQPLNVLTVYFVCVCWCLDDRAAGLAVSWQSYLGGFHIRRTVQHICIILARLANQQAGGHCRMIGHCRMTRVQHAQSIHAGAATAALRLRVCTCKNTAPLSCVPWEATCLASFVCMVVR